MEFNDFFTHYNRMCLSYFGCLKCPLNDKKSDSIRCRDFIFEYPDKAERIVSKWKEEHPPTTNADKFREVFGTIIMGVPNILASASQVEVDGKSLNEWSRAEYHPPENKDR